MLAARVEKWAMEYEQKGIQIGEQRGEQRGRQEGEVRLLLRQLTRRFGNLSSWVHEKVNVADLETLETWGDKILDANSIEDVFGHSPIH